MLSTQTPEVTTAPLKSPAISKVIWAVLLVTNLLSLTAAFLAFQTRNKLTQEVAQIKSEAIRFGQPVQIYNPKWGTVIDGVDPSIFPSRDLKDPRRGAALQQFVPRGNDAQRWVLQRPGENLAQPAPLPFRTYKTQAMGFLLAHDLPKAIKAFERCVELYPDEPEAHDGLARALKDAGNFPAALASHKRALELDPERVSFYWERGLTYMRAGQNDEAIRDFNACLERDATFADALNSLAILHRNQSKLDEALKFHNEAVALGPRRDDFYRERAVTLERKGDQQGASQDRIKAQQLRNKEVVN
ncbi:MAG: tetratricopeptide repeat protein [Verrucomicrobiales bacterium]|nr:tetratricopeptide repeat protein [Verrucomicrobiales bacterium]